MQSLEVISVNFWQIIISLANLLILYLILKKFLYAPVKNAVASRRASVDGQYALAEEAKRAALADKSEYEDKLRAAQLEAESIRRNAVSEAERKGDRIVAEAKEKADGMVRRAEEQISLERRKASDDMKREIAEVSAELAEKLIGREIDEKDHRGFIDSFIEGVGDSDDTGK